MFHFSFFFADPPEIELETDRVHSGENKEAHLTCLIHGNPTPTVSWFSFFSLVCVLVWCGEERNQIWGEGESILIDKN